MATNIPAIGNSNIANLPSQSNGTLAGNQLPEDGAAWGAEVFHESHGDSSFNFDNYAASTQTQMQQAGFSPSAVTQFMNAMYAGYLASGGEATAQFTGQFGTSTGTATGFYAASNAGGTLGLPGTTGGEPSISQNGGSGLSLNMSTASMLGTTLASTNSVDYRQWRTNMENDLVAAGYAPGQVAEFMEQVDTTYFAAQPNNLVNQGISAGAASGITSPTQLQNSISSVVIPALQKQGLSADQINQYLEGYRAGAIGGSSNSQLVISGLGQGEEVASAAAGDSSFNFDTYSQSIASYLASPSMQLTEAQQQAYMAAMRAGYLRGGGTATSEASTVWSGAAYTGFGNGFQSQSAATAVSVGTTAWWATQIYNAVASMSNPTLTADAAAVSTADAALSTAAALYNQQPTSTHLVNLQAQWQVARSAEAKFWTDASGLGGQYAATAATIAASFRTDLHFTMEGDMPSSWAGGTAPAPASTAAFMYLTQLAASNALGAGVSLPSNLGDIITNPNAVSSLTQTQFTGLAEGLVALYAANPAQYYDALNSIQDPQLRATLNYTVQDITTNGSDSLVQNHATPDKEAATLSMYYNNMEQNPSTYSAWLPATSGPTALQSSTGLNSIPLSTSDYTNVRNYLNSSSYTNNQNVFAESAAMMANLWQTNQAAYYQVLSGIPNAELRNALNTAVQKEFTDNPQNIGTPRAFQDYDGILNSDLNKTGVGASSATWIGAGNGGSNLQISTQTGGLHS